MWIYPKVVAHRGGGSLAPENTFAALRCGLAHRFHAVEFDVMLSGDGIPILMHDPEFGRTVSGRGSVCTTTAKALTLMDAGIWFGPAFAGERVPLFEDVINFCKKNDVWMNVEIKPAPSYEEVTGRVVAQMTQRLFSSELAAPDRNNPARLPLLSSFSFDALMAAKVVAPDIARGYLVDVIPPDWFAQLNTLEATALHTNQKNLTPALVNAVKQAGFGLFCYTVNEPIRAKEIIAWGVNGFCTDRIDLIGPQFV